MQNIQVEKEIVMRPIATVKPYVRNPRKNDKTVELLVKMIPKVGFNVPLVIDENGIIVKGHARFFAAIRLGLTEVPCIVTHADEEAVKVDRITDNKISEFAEWDEEGLFKEVDDIGLDLSDIGLPKVDLSEVKVVEAEDLKEDEEEAEEIKRLAEELGGNEEEIAEAVKEFYSTAFYKCVCENCGHTQFIPEGQI